MSELIAIAQARVQRQNRLPATPADHLDYLASRAVVLHDVCAALGDVESPGALLADWRDHALAEFSAALSAHASHFEES